MSPSTQALRLRQVVTAGIIPAEGAKDGQQVEDVDGPIAETRVNITITDATAATIAREALQHAEKVEDVDDAVAVHVAISVWCIGANLFGTLIKRAHVAVVTVRVKRAWDYHCAATDGRHAAFANETRGHVDSAIVDRDARAGSHDKRVDIKRLGAEALPHHIVIE